MRVREGPNGLEIAATEDCMILVMHVKIALAVAPCILSQFAERQGV
jgi:hypothetical protein